MTSPLRYVLSKLLGVFFTVTIWGCVMAATYYMLQAMGATK